MDYLIRENARVYSVPFDGLPARKYLEDIEANESDLSALVAAGFITVVDAGLPGKFVFPPDLNRFEARRRYETIYAGADKAREIVDAYILAGARGERPYFDHAREMARKAIARAELPYAKLAEIAENEWPYEMMPFPGDLEGAEWRLPKFAPHAPQTRDRDQERFERALQRGLEAVQSAGVDGIRLTDLRLKSTHNSPIDFTTLLAQLKTMGVTTFSKSAETESGVKLPGRPTTFAVMTALRPMAAEEGEGITTGLDQVICFTPRHEDHGIDGVTFGYVYESFRCDGAHIWFRDDKGRNNKIPGPYWNNRDIKHVVRPLYKPCPVHLDVAYEGEL